MKPKPALPSEVLRLRARMDRLNAKLVADLQARARLCLRIGRAKERLGLASIDRGREQEMLERALAQPPPGFPPRALRQLLRAIFKESRRLVQTGRSSKR